MNPTRLRAYLKLHLADGVGPLTFARLAESLGGVEAAASASRGRWMSVQGVGEKTADALAGITDADIDAEINAAQKAGAEIFTREDETYPAALRNLPDAPPVLYVRGRLEPADAIAMAVVGSRHCTHYGLEQAQRFGELLGRAGFTVISGGARGIDTAAHRGALAAGGRTVAVMGCGLCTHYPAENADLFEQIVRDARGALVSELPMRTAVMGGNFPMRNRIISGLSLGVLIVEAARRSGSLITADIANEQGRTVFAVPGRVDSPLSGGTNELIRKGAILVQNLPDILEHLGKVGEAMGEPAEKSAAGTLFAQPVVTANLSEAEQSLLEALREGPLSVDELVRRSQLPAGKVASSMTLLVLKGAVTQQPGNLFARRQAGTA